MESISVEEFLEHPDKLLADAHDGVIDVVTQDGKPVFMTIPLGANLDSPDFRLELAVSLFDREQVSIGVARFSEEEISEEMKHVRSLDGPT